MDGGLEAKINEGGESRTVLFSPSLPLSLPTPLTCVCRAFCRPVLPLSHRHRHRHRIFGYLHTVCGYMAASDAESGISALHEPSCRPSARQRVPA